MIFNNDKECKASFNLELGKITEKVSLSGDKQTEDLIKWICEKEKIEPKKLLTRYVKSRLKERGFKNIEELYEKCESNKKHKLEFKLEFQKALDGNISAFLRSELKRDGKRYDFI